MDKNNNEVYAVIANTQSPKEDLKEIDVIKTKVFKDYDKAREYFENTVKKYNEKFLESVFGGDKEWMEDCSNTYDNDNGNAKFVMWDDVSMGLDIELVLQKITLS